MGNSYDWWTLIGLLIAVARVVFYFRLCCDSIPARRHFNGIMHMTTFIELITWCVQMGYIISDWEQFCVVTTVAPVFGLSCAGSLWFIMIVNLLTIKMYFYFSFVAYEHYFMGCVKPDLLAKEITKKEKIAMEKEMKAKMVDNMSGSVVEGGQPAGEVKLAPKQESELYDPPVLVTS